MKNLMFLILCLGISSAVRSQTIARQVIGSSGMSFSGGSLQTDWTVGETVTFQFSNASLVVNQGFHQPLLNAVNIAAVKSGDIRIYPVPATEMIHVSLKNGGIKLLYIEMYTLTGQLLGTFNTINDGVASINISGYVPGVYTLRTITDSGSIVTPIVKIE